MTAMSQQNLETVTATLPSKQTDALHFHHNFLHIIWRTSPNQDWTIKEVRSGWKGICYEQGFVWNAKGNMSFLRTLHSIWENCLISLGCEDCLKGKKMPEDLKIHFFQK